MKGDTKNIGTDSRNINKTGHSKITKENATNKSVKNEQGKISNWM